MVSTLVENSKNFVHLFVNFFFVKIIIMTSEPTHTASKEGSGTTCPSYQLSSEKCSINYTSLLAMFNLLRSITNQELFDKHLCNQSSHYEKYGLFSL